jgi:hypothetical protein
MSEETLEVALKRIHNFMEQRKTASSWISSTAVLVSIFSQRLQPFWFF